jgi:uncharacterized protein
MQRDRLVDTLRGIALFGILVVNIQSFGSGLSGPPIGLLDDGSSYADHLTVIFTAMLFEYKFYPIFSFCFGYGFAVQTRRWRVLRAPVHQRFTRRMNAMLAMGVVHGIFIWFGDILSRYAITGYILRNHAGKGPRHLRTATYFWFKVMAGVTILTVLPLAFVDLMADPASVTEQQALRNERTQSIEAYTIAGYADATSQRIKDYALITAGFVVLIPQLMFLFLLGALAEQLGLLRHPGRYRQFWRRMLWIGLSWGIPVNLAYAGLQWQYAMNPWQQNYSALGALLGTAAPLICLSYVAALALGYGTHTGNRIQRIFEPAGRYALTLYVGESLLMTVLLGGVGMGLGATASPAQFFLFAIAIYLTLLLTAHLMLRNGLSGPLETIWRRYTYADTKTNRANIPD